MRHIARVLLSILCALAVTLTPAGAESALLDPIAGAVGYCDVDKAKQLIANGADVNAEIPPFSHGEIRIEGQTLLHLAAQFCDSSEMFDILIKQGANVQAKNSSGRTPLHWASLYGNIHAITSLIQMDADVNAKDTKKWTPLFTAIVGGGENAEIVTALIQAGADVNAVDIDGATPLHLTAGVGHSKIAIALIEAGAYVDATTDYGSTPLDFAKLAKNWSVAAILENPPPVKYR